MKCVLYEVFTMHYTEDFCMHHYAGLLQIGSHMLSYYRPVLYMYDISLAFSSTYSAHKNSSVTS